MSALPREPGRILQTPGDRQDEILKGSNRPPTSLPNQVALEQMNKMMYDHMNHKIIWEKFTNRKARGKEFEAFVRENDLSKKRLKLIRYAVDADDALYMSREYLAIEALRGRDWAVKHMETAHSATELDYGDSGKVDHGEPDKFGNFKPTAR